MCYGTWRIGQLLRIYVGEAIPFVTFGPTRQAEDFWTHAVVFTSKDQNLNKAHVKYLEAALVQWPQTPNG
jgi:hypothetical protein